MTLKNFSKSYNERSNIPQKLVADIFNVIYKAYIFELKKKGA